MMGHWLGRNLLNHFGTSLEAGVKLPEEPAFKERVAAGDKAEEFSEKVSATVFAVGFVG